MKKLLLCGLLFLSEYALGQYPGFPLMEQLAASAYPLCGKDTFRQLYLPPGSAGQLNIPGCGLAAAINPCFYKFTCYASGTLLITITPLDMSQDFNFELYDVTNHNPTDIYTDNTLAIVGNWSEKPGRTGTRNNGVSTQCLSNGGRPADSTYSQAPVIVEGHQYLLLVCCYSKSQSDYFVGFAGSTAIISNYLLPRMQSATVGCDKKRIQLVMNKKLRCYPLAADGSDFRVNGIAATITAASGNGCSTQFDYNTLELTLLDPLPPGDYTLEVQQGTDGNTLWDDCFNEIHVGKPADPAFIVQSLKIIFVKKSACPPPSNARIAVMNLRWKRQCPNNTKKICGIR